MKRKIIIIGMLLILFIATTVGGNALLKKFQGEDEFKQAGTGMAEAVSALNEAGGRYNSSDLAEYVGEVEGERISKLYFEVRYYSYKSNPLNYEDPKQEAWNSIKLEFWEKHFAEAKGIAPTLEEIKEYVEYTAGEYDATDEGRHLISAYADGMGMTVREYWEYNKKYQAPAAVTHGKVSRYLENNGLEAPSYDEIESKITDKEYFDLLT
ncbi:MAG: hypothetical protein DBY08_04105 [Clostridiales bacterium]|nr:MAG: hypothetical protein DBY08_04105 [Clostridiales bacterium]